MSYRFPTRSGVASLVCGVIFPAIVIVIELVSGFCASSFFDPLPTLGHIALVSAVPVINYLLWRAAGRDDDPNPWLLLAGGGAFAVAAVYTLLFLPMLPLAVVAIILAGLGLLPFAPIMAAIFALRWLFDLAARGQRLGRRAVAGFTIGLLLLTLIDLPATATYLALDRYRGDASNQASAVALMRALGDRETLLRLSYGDTVRATGLVSAFVSICSNGFFTSGRGDAGDARELYYRVTGKAFNAVERPVDRSDRFRMFGWDDDQGGNSVGGRVPGLALATSRIDGSVAASDNLAYVEWTLTVANRSAAQHEARFTLALPEGAVASRATLWVNGEPREASIAGRGEARAAYTKVVYNDRDPLLITTSGAQRLLVQAFPVAVNDTLQLRIGYTAPFTIASDGRRELALPAIVERNFDVPGALRHKVWIQGDGALASPDATLAASGTMLRGGLTDEDLLAHRPRILIARQMAASIRLGGVPATGKIPPLTVIQTIARDTAPRPSALMIVLDGSVGDKAAGEALVKALDAIPSGVPTGLSIAADTPVTIGPVPWSAAQRERVTAAITATRFVGGQDNGPALASALAAASQSNAALLWVHGPQPVAFATSQAEIQQMVDRLESLPALVRYQAEPGRAFAIEGNRWFDTARFVSPTGNPKSDLAGILSAMAGAGPRWTVLREEQPGVTTTGSVNIVRLWAAEQLSAQAGAKGKQREAALGLANRLNLVTPLSGAVVLETDKDYKDNGLPTPSADDVPTVPEPEVWALLIVLALAGGWLLRRRSRVLA